MSIPIIIFFCIVGIATVMFITEVFSVDKTAFLVMVSLLITNLVSAPEAVSGFSNPAVLTILSLMIISAALEYNGSIKLLSKLIEPIIKLKLILALPIIMLLVGSISAFVSTTAVVILFVKIVPDIAKKYNIPIEKYMIPISYAGIMGGSCTLMGTSTNLLVSQIAVEKGITGFSFFQFTWLAGILLLVGILVVTVLSLLLLKNKGHISLTTQAKPPSYVTVIELSEDSSLVGKSYKDTRFYKNENSTLLHLRRGNNTIKHPTYWQKFRVGDRLVIRADMESIQQIRSSSDFQIIGSSEKQVDTPYKAGKVVEILILPNSKFVGTSFAELTKYDLDGALPIALRKHKNILHPNDRFIKNRLSRIRIDVGDRLLVELDVDNEENWSLQDHLEILDSTIEPFNINNRRYLSLAILAIVIGLAATGFFTILKSALIGVGLLILFRCITLEKAYKAINWQIIFLLACLLPLGTAMSNVNADFYLSYKIMSYLEGYSATVVISTIFLITMLISSVISNNATAIILSPIAIAVSNALGIDPVPTLLAVMLGANFSFFTPLGYQTNTIIYGMGIYRFKDFLIIGGVLSVILWLLASFLLSTLVS